MLIDTKHFNLVISMSDLVVWDELKDECHPNPDLLETLKIMDIELNLVKMYFHYFDEIAVGEGDVYCYKSNGEYENIFSINLYRQLTDQLDIIHIGIECAKGFALKIKPSIRRFFDAASCKICYEEANISRSVLNLMNEQLYPKIIEETGYLQKYHTVPANKSSHSAN